jgi:hypothetical protein
MTLAELVTFPAPHPNPGAIVPDCFEDRQQALARFNRERIAPGIGEDQGYCAILHRQQMEVLERGLCAG